MFKVKQSNISGKGIFADRDINKNEVIGLAFEKLKDTRFPDEDYKRMSLGTFTNHSDGPNLKIKKDKNKIFFIAGTKIKEGDELTIDYKDFDWEGKIKFK